jgi:ornithine decarboxylase
LQFNNSRTVMNVMSAKSLDLVHQVLETGHEDSFVVVDLDDVAFKAREWARMLPRVKPFYAVKCNPDERVLEVLHRHGAGFDCASKGEIASAVRVGAKPEDIIYANPCKQPSHLRAAKSHGVRMMTFDNADEATKIKQVMPDAQLVLRIATDDSNAVCKLSNKFGAALNAVKPLLRHATSLGLDVIGISFHVGSGCKEEAAFVDALQRARAAFDIGLELGLSMHLLDIGGGFPGLREDRDECAPADLTFTRIANILRPALDKYFPADCGISLIAEPGRFFVHSCAVTVTQVIARRIIGSDGNQFVMNNSAEDECVESLGAGHERLLDHAEVDSVMYYVNDGLYGTFNCVIYDHARLNPMYLEPRRNSSRTKQVDEEQEQPAIRSMASAESLASAQSNVECWENVISSETDVMTVGAETSNVSCASSSGLNLSSESGGLPQTEADDFSGVDVVANQEVMFRSSVWGPTCDGLDCIIKDAALPQLSVGSVVVFPNTGAYTCAAGSTFNGFERPEVYYVAN